MKLLKKTKPYHIKDYKFNLAVLVAALATLGVFVVGSAKRDVQGKQFAGLLIGLSVMIILSLIDYIWITNFYWILYFLSVGMLLLVLVPGIGEVVNGSRRWINIGFTNFQPSELSKIFLIIFFAKFLMVHEEDLNDKKTILEAVGLILVPLFLIYKEPNLSTVIVVILLFCTLMYAGGVSYKTIGTALDRKSVV